MDYLTNTKKISKRDVKEVFAHCKELNSTYSKYEKGWTKDRTMRHVTSIPLWVLFDPEYGKYFDPAHNPEELKKDIDKFLARTNWIDFQKHG